MHIKPNDDDDDGGITENRKIKPKERKRERHGDLFVIGQTGDVVVVTAERAEQTSKIA